MVDVMKSQRKLCHFDTIVVKYFKLSENAFKTTLFSVMEVYRLSKFDTQNDTYFNVKTNKTSIQ